MCLGQGSSEQIAAPHFHSTPCPMKGCCLYFTLTPWPAETYWVKKEPGLVPAFLPFLQEQVLCRMEQPVA